MNFPSFFAQIPALAWLILSAVFFAGGEYLSKKFAMQPSWGLALLICFIYMGGSMAWLPAIHKTNQLAVTGLLWSAITTLVTISIGILVFAEKVTLLQAIGMTFAFVSVLLLSIA